MVQPDQNKELPTTPLASRASSAPSDTFTKSILSYPSSKSEFGRNGSYFGVQVFNYRELEEATDNFSQSRELGDGGFGTVYYGTIRNLDDFLFLVNIYIYIYLAITENRLNLFCQAFSMTAG